ncbi:ABC transporter substrate-binding protein, partial [Anaerobacillus sp. 1_MG-2023]|nr:ABC transporter substrate-binding protein [Anaerobacillus sp. 1_MG-2023]
MYTSVFLLILWACGTISVNDQVRVAEVTRSIVYAPQYVALSEGIVEKHGIDVALTTTWGGDKTMTTLLS